MTRGKQAAMLADDLESVRAGSLSEENFRAKHAVDRASCGWFIMKRGITVLVLFLAGCQYNPFAHEFTTRRPVDESVVGKYSPDTESQARLRAHLKVELSSNCKLFLNSDKTFAAHDLPRCWINTFQCVSGTEDWKGTWSIEQAQDWWAIRLRVTSRNGQPTDYGIPAMLRGEAPPYLLHLTIGDPDSGDALAFQREISNIAVTAASIERRGRRPGDDDSLRNNGGFSKRTRLTRELRR